MENIKSSIAKIGVSQGYFQNSDYTKPKRQLKNQSITFVLISIFIMFLGNILICSTPLDFAFGGFFILGFAFIFSAIYFFMSSKKCILLTQLLYYSFLFNLL